ncbi:MAG: AraC family ligand binding domain-containing protein, partial [Pseudomonadota bacterium]
MQTETYRLEAYLRDGETFHYARKLLSKRFPPLAHDHDFYEIFMIIRGRTQHWINGVTQTLEQGQLMFMRPGDAHAFRAAREGCEIINVMYRSDTATHLLERYADTLSGRFFGSHAPLPELHTLGPRQFE